MSDIQLKPCPYCQSDNVGVECSRGSDDDGMIRHFYYGFCGGCHMAGPEVSNEEGEGIAEEQAAEAWNALPRHLRWTREKPTEPGWYWLQDDDGFATIVNVYHSSVYQDQALVCKPYGAYGATHTVDIPNAQWAGPIPEPGRRATAQQRTTTP